MDFFETSITWISGYIALVSPQLLDLYSKVMAKKSRMGWRPSLSELKGKDVDYVGEKELLDFLFPLIKLDFFLTFIL